MSLLGVQMTGNAVASQFAENILVEAYINYKHMLIIVKGNEKGLDYPAPIDDVKA
jgi:hypothetical protein